MRLVKCYSCSQEPERLTNSDSFNFYIVKWGYYSECYCDNCLDVVDSIENDGYTVTVTKI